MTQGNYYIQAVMHLRWLLDAMEAYLEHIPDISVINPRALQMVASNRMATQDEVAIVIEALVDLGILLPGPPLCFSRQQLIGTEGYRRGVRDTLAVVPSPESSIQLCATLPNSLSSAIIEILQEELLDLRTTLFDIIASAHQRIIIASPFWDGEAGKELTDLFTKRLTSGITIDVLGRVNEGKDNTTYLDLAKRFADRPNLHFYNWYKPSTDRFLTQTFHFKAAVIDNGSKAYLGSANMTSGGLRSRMELGVLLQGKAAHSLARILNTILGVSTRIDKNT